MSSEAIESDILNYFEYQKRARENKNLTSRNIESNEAVRRTTKNVYDLQTLLKLENSPLSHSPIDLTHIPELSRKVSLKDTLDAIPF